MQIWSCKLPRALMHGESPLAAAEKEANTQAWGGRLAVSPRPLSPSPSTTRTSLLRVLAAQLDTKFTASLAAKCGHMTRQ